MTEQAVGCGAASKPGPNCHECPLKEEPYVPPHTHPGAQIMVVGEAPGETETRTGTPFTGSSGRVLRAVLAQVLDVEKDGDLPVAFTNTVLCRPPGNADPPVEAVQACAPLLVSALEEQTHAAGSKPVVLAVGRVALTRFAGQALVQKITASRSVWDGYVYLPFREIMGTATLGTVERPGPDKFKSGPRKGQPKPIRVPATVATGNNSFRGLVAALHPAAVMRTGFKDLPRLTSACSAASRLAAGESVYLGPDNFARQWEPDLDGRILAADCVAFDIENPDRVNIAQIGFAGSNEVVTSQAWNPASQALTRKILERDSGPLLVAHNAQYDVAHLEAAGVQVRERRLVDTMLAAQVLEPDLPKALGKVAQRFILLSPWKHFDEVDHAKYNAMDADVTVRIWQEMAKQLDERGQMRFFLDAIMPGSMVLRRMTKRGIKVSTAALAQWKAELEVELEQLRAKWEVLTYDDEADEAVSPDSPKQLAKYLYERLGLPVVERTASGSPSTSKAALVKLARRTEHPALELLAELRDRSKSLGTYAKDQGVGDDGCVHPQYLPEGKDDGDYGTASLRLAARNPNIQNQPVVARFQYVPHHPGWVVGETDFSQIEGRLVAVLSGDPDLLEGYETGVDLHQRNADLWGVPRSMAKGILYAMQYGAGAGTIARQFEAPVTQARGWLDAYAKAHPKVWEWQQETIRKAATYGYLQNPFGMRRWFPGLSRDDAHVRNQALNFMPQSIVAGITWYLLHPLERLVEELGGHLLTQVHDSFVWEAPGERAEQVAKLVQRCMERTWDMVAPEWYCPTDSSVGESWGHAGQNDKEARDGQTGLDVWIEKGRPTHAED